MSAPHPYFTDDTPERRIDLTQLTLPDVGILLLPRAELEVYRP